MMGPQNYVLDVQQPVQTALQGYAAGAGIRDDQRQQQALLASQQRQQQMQDDLAGVMDNPSANAKDYAGLTLKYPELREQLKQSWDMAGSEQKQARLDIATRAYAAMATGRNDVAEKIMRDRAAAMRNSGASEEDVNAQEMWADMVRSTPDKAHDMAGLMLASVMDPKDFAETFSKLQTEKREGEMAGPKLAEQQAKAEKAGVEAKYAEGTVLADIEKKGWDVKKIQSDIEINKQNSRIAAMNAATARMSAGTGAQANALKLQELQMKMADAVTARDEKIKEKVNEAETAVSGVSSSLGLIDEIRKSPGLGMSTGASSFMAAVPGSDARTTAGKISQLQDSLAAVNLDKLKGAMSDKDIAFLRNIASNLDRGQDEKSFAAELTKIEGVLKSADTRLRAKFGMPAAQDAPAGATPGSQVVRGKVTTEGGRPPLSSFAR